MVEIKNFEVFNLERAQRAIENSFNVGDINTTEGTIKEKLSKSLFSNNDYKQSHNACSAGVIVQFVLKSDGDFVNVLNGFHFLEISKLKSKDEYFVTTNFRQLAHLYRSRNAFNDNEDFRKFTGFLLTQKDFANYCLKKDEKE